jgi:hypothetical protein
VGKNTILRQKIIFFPIAEGGAKNFAVFRVKNHDFTPQNFFNNYARKWPILPFDVSQDFIISKKILV